MADQQSDPAAGPSTSSTAAAPANVEPSLEGVQVTQPGLLAASTQPGDEAEEDGPDDSDADSAFGSDAASSTASVSASIMEYRTLQGRTYHSERHNQDYFTPNDEQQLESVDIVHHYLTLLLGGKLFLPPLQDDIQEVLDVGTGTGIWAIDMADQFPGATITGTDLSPIQPAWVPPNVKFEIDDCTLPWLYPDNRFDFVHLRFLFGGIADYEELFRQAYRCTKPGGYMQSAECDVQFSCDDGTIPEGGVIDKLWNPLHETLGKKIGRSFTVVRDRVQTKAMQAAGFEDIREYNYKTPVGRWPLDPNLAEVGELAKIATLNDLEGYTLFPYKTIMGDKFDYAEYQVWLASIRKEIRFGKMHGYYKTRYVYGRKPLNG